MMFAEDLSLSNKVWHLIISSLDDDESVEVMASRTRSIASFKFLSVDM
jgi:hypothetical protein